MNTDERTKTPNDSITDSADGGSKYNSYKSGQYNYERHSRAYCGRARKSKEELRPNEWKGKERMQSSAKEEDTFHIVTLSEGKSNQDETNPTRFVNQGNNDQATSFSTKSLGRSYQGNQNNSDPEKEQCPKNNPSQIEAGVEAARYSDGTFVKRRGTDSEKNLEKRGGYVEPENLENKNHPQQSSCTSTESNLQNIPLKELTTTVENLLKPFLDTGHDIKEILAQNNVSNIERDKFYVHTLNKFMTKNNSLKEKNFDLNEENTQIKCIYQQAVNKYANIELNIQTLCKEIEKGKSVSTSTKFLNAFTGKPKYEEEDTITCVKKISDYIKILLEDMDRQETLIRIKTVENNKLLNDLSDSKNKNTSLIKCLEDTRKDLTERLDNEIKKNTELQTKSKVAENDYKKKITEKNSVLRNMEREYEEEIAKLKRSCTNQQNENQKLLKEKNDTEKKRKIENQNLQYELQQSKLKLQKTGAELENFKSKWQNEIKTRQSIEGKTQNMQETIQKLEETSMEEQKKFKTKLEEMFKNIEAYTIKISLEDLKRDSENNIIEQAVSKICEVENSVEKYENQIREFEGDTQNKTYLDIKEMLMRAIEKLDFIESHRREKIKIRRKKAINYIKDLQDQLERKVHRK